MKCGYKISLIIRCLVSHFGLSAFVGSLAYLLTWTILSHITGLEGLMGGFPIHHFSLLVALSFSALAHILQDYFLGWF